MNDSSDNQSQIQGSSNGCSSVKIGNNKPDDISSGAMVAPSPDMPNNLPPSSGTGSMNSPLSGFGGMSASASGSGSVSQLMKMSGTTSYTMRMGTIEETEISSRYDVGEQVGRGASAIVYEAWRKTDRLHVVIKVLQVAALDEKEAHVAIKRFYREAELITKLKEEHIVQCVDYGRFMGTPCMVLEYVNGLSLDKFLAQYGAIPLAYSTGIIEQLLLALEETHARGVIHRDIKPGNIMVFDSSPPYTIRVLDFGISTVLDGFQSKTLMTQTGNVRGTPSYMAPELFTGETRASIESDLYAVGLVYLECLTGEVVVNDTSFVRVAYKQVNEPVEVPGYVPTSIADIIIKLCAKPVNDRYHSARVVLDDIHAVLPQALEEEENCFKEWKRSNQTLYHRGTLVSSAALSSMETDVRPLYKQPKYIAAAAGLLFLSIVLILILINMNENAQETKHVQELTAEDDSEQLSGKKQITVAIDKASEQIDRVWAVQTQVVIKEYNDDKKKAEDLAQAKQANENSESTDSQNNATQKNKKTKKKDATGLINMFNKDKKNGGRPKDGDRKPF